MLQSWQAVEQRQIWLRCLSTAMFNYLTSSYLTLGK